MGLARRSVRYNTGSPAGRVTVNQGDLRSPLPPGAAPPSGFDLVTGTPPYIPQGDGGVARCVEVVPREGKPPLMHVYVIRWLQGGGSEAPVERFIVRDAQGRLSPEMHAARAAIGMPPAKV